MLATRGTTEGLNVALTELIEHGIARQCYWQMKTCDGAPAGSAEIGADFRAQVLMIFCEYRPDASEASWRRWAGDVWREFGDADLDPRKHAKRFKARFATRKNASRS
jgi:hypothetical protein